MRAVVTGAAGFIGGHLCEALVAEGYEVLGLDDLSLGRRGNTGALSDDPAFTLEVLDVRDLGALLRAMGSGPVDVVYHLAANSDISKSLQDPAVDAGRTLGTTLAVLEAVRLRDVPRLVFASTSAVYGELDELLTEAHPCRPISHYGAAKLASEAFIHSYAASYGLQAWVPRFPNVVGPRATHGAVFDFVRKVSEQDHLDVLGDGRQTKPYLHVSDLVAALLHAQRTMSEMVNVFNVAGLTRCSVARMAEIVVEESGRSLPIRFGVGDRGWVGDVPSVRLDASRLSSTGWEPVMDAESAVRLTARALLEEKR